MAFLLPYHLLSSLSLSLSTKFGTHKTWSATQSLCVVKGSVRGGGGGDEGTFPKFQQFGKQIGGNFCGATVCGKCNRLWQSRQCIESSCRTTQQIGYSVRGKQVEKREVQGSRRWEEMEENELNKINSVTLCLAYPMLTHLSLSLFNHPLNQAVACLLVQLIEKPKHFQLRLHFPNEFSALIRVAHSNCVPLPSPSLLVTLPFQSSKILALYIINSAENWTTHLGLNNSKDLQHD